MRLASLLDDRGVALGFALAGVGLLVTHGGGSGSWRCPFKTRVAVGPTSAASCCTLGLYPKISMAGLQDSCKTKSYRQKISERGGMKKKGARPGGWQGAAP